MASYLSVYWDVHLPEPRLTYAYVDLVFTTLMKLITPGSLGNAQAT